MKCVQWNFFILGDNPLNILLHFDGAGGLVHVTA